MQYALVNGMPYLIPAAYLPMLHLQQMQMQMYAPLLLMNPDGTPSLQHIPVFTAQQAQMAAAPGTGPGSPERNAQEIAARDQRRAASLWLLMKLAFGVYLFSQNGSIERIVLLHIAALIIFLHQTGRLRIVRRIVQPPADAPPGVGVPQPGNQEQTPNPAQQPPQAATTAASDSASGSSGGAVSGTSKPTTAGSGSISNQASAASEASASSTTAESSQAQLEGSAGTQQHQQQQQPRVSTWRSIEHALLTFVTSLVPAPPPDIDPAVANAAAAGERGM
ncbi:hypothetical protein BGX28_001330 [Mortierella sp. GBA30]|nr:hypothetical protein BGX28_001330 [Mortierella sp. GBA30]